MRSATRFRRLAGAPAFQISMLKYGGVTTWTSSRIRIGRTQLGEPFNSIQAIAASSPVFPMTTSSLRRSAYEQGFGRFAFKNTSTMVFRGVWFTFQRPTISKNKWLAILRVGEWSAIMIESVGRGSGRVRRSQRSVRSGKRPVEWDF